MAGEKTPRYGIQAGKFQKTKSGHVRRPSTGGFRARREHPWPPYALPGPFGCFPMRYTHSYG